MSRRRICRRDETFIFSFFFLHFSLFSAPASFPSCISILAYLSLTLPLFLSLSLSAFFFLPLFRLSLSLSLSLLITDGDRSSGLLAFSSSSEEKKRGGGGGGRRRRKAPLSVPLLLLHGTGGTKAFPDRPDRLYLHPANVSSPSVFTTLPHSLFSFCHKPPCLIRITQYKGISVWHVEEEIARKWLTLNVISLRGCDYMFMCIFCATCEFACCMPMWQHHGDCQ